MISKRDTITSYLWRLLPTFSYLFLFPGRRFKLLWWHRNHISCLHWHKCKPSWTDYTYKETEFVNVSYLIKGKLFYLNKTSFKSVRNYRISFRFFDKCYLSHHYAKYVNILFLEIPLRCNIILVIPLRQNKEKYLINLGLWHMIYDNRWCCFCFVVTGKRLHHYHLCLKDNPC